MIVWIFAGAFRTENREKQVGTAFWLTARGYAVAAHTEFRGASPSSVFPDNSYHCF